MTSQVVIEPQAGVVEAAQRMIAEKKGPLPVVEGGRVVAIVSDRDLISRVVAAGQDPKSMKVADVDTHDLVTIAPDAAESQAAS